MLQVVVVGLSDLFPFSPIEMPPFIFEQLSFFLPALSDPFSFTLRVYATALQVHARNGPLQVW